MCSRYYRKSDKQKIAEAFHVRGDLSSLVLAPTNYNVAPVTFQSVVCNGKETGERELVLMRWGLIPFFAKSEEQYKDLSTINAKADNLTKSNMWREPFKRHRCLVPADGLYEWPKPGHLISTTYDPAPTVETDAEESGNLFDTEMQAIKQVKAAKPVKRVSISPWPIPRRCSSPSPASGIRGSAMTAPT
jgi:hypothetical protein